MSKSTAFMLALVSVLLGILFAYLREFVYLGTAMLLMLIFNGIWAAKVERDRRLSKLHHPVVPEPPILKTSNGSNRLIVPQSS